MRLKGKRVLITAGPTWVPIDKVRVISNVASGTTGILLAQELCKLGAKVTLLLGPAGSCYLNKNIKLIHFKFFDELKSLIAKEIKSVKFNIVVHSAAVADYRPRISLKKKVRSGMKGWVLNLVPTPKIIDLIKKLDKDLFLVGFKFEPLASRKKLIGEAKILMERAKLDLVIANTVDKNRYQAYIVSQNQAAGPIRSKKGLVQKLIKEISFNY